MHKTIQRQGDRQSRRQLYQRSATNLKGSRVGSNYHSASLAARSSLLQITEEILLRRRDDGKSPASQKIHF